ncbi:hypothetical protein [Virgibacillus dokdonensis]|uniref:Peptidase S9 prolyl oligopeptidase catalytic domain-containing protein n=1 Tax=Virgibacillus dokdonensis TaxID=302167 RepID=A0ABU7VIE0_9BACI
MSNASHHNIPKEKIISCGSSKGGTAALYYGIKYNFGYVIAGGFQIKVGDYLYSTSEYTRETVLNFITGGTDKKHKDYLNKFFLGFVNHSKVTSNIYIHGGKGDSHYRQHVTTFIEIMKRRNMPYHLDLQNYSSHSQVGSYFSSFISEVFSKITNSITITSIA